MLNTDESRNALVIRDPIESIIDEWLTQRGTIGSPRTVKEYRATLASFRQFLARTEAGGSPGWDVLPIMAQSQEDVAMWAGELARIALLWANARQPARRKKDGTDSARFDARTPVSPAMYNQRLAILSSFWSFVQETYKHRLKVDLPNPAEAVPRRKVQAYASAEPIDRELIEQGLDSIDRSTTEGLRDYALLAVALRTGRRASELAGLRGADVTITGRGKDMRVRMVFHAKGGKLMKDKLDEDTSAVALDYLHARFGKQLQVIPPTAPIWVSYSRNTTNGKAIGIRTLSNICAHYMPTSKVHALRHSFATESENLGIPISEISFRMGHASEKQTSTYLKQSRSEEMKRGRDLARRMGIKRRDGRRA